LLDTGRSRRLSRVVVAVGLHGLLSHNIDPRDGWL
jgi:hypothetical protein